MRFANAALTLVLSGLPSPAQDPIFQVKVDVPLVSIDVKVSNARGQPMTSLTAKDFLILEDGEEQQLQDFVSVETPYNILLLFDRSGSTESLWTTMERSADRFIRNLRSQDRVALAAFDEGVMMLSGWNDSRATAQRALNELSDRGRGGGTILYQSLERVVRREFYRISGRSAVVVMTDGWDATLFDSLRRGTGADRFQQTINVLRTARVPVYFVALNTDKNPSSDLNPSDVFVRTARNRMELLADVSGGAIFFPRGNREIVEAYNQVSLGLANSYSLAYTSSHAPVTGQTHRIEVRVRGAQVKQSRATYLVH